jgi:predicted HAD superfamily Cof-like phosphohydrolase
MTSSIYPEGDEPREVDTTAPRDRHPYTVLSRDGVLLTVPSQTALDVEAFHRKYGFPVRDEPGLPLDEDRDFYLKLMDEEVAELHRAAAEGNLIEVLDALADITYLAYGWSLLYGTDLDAALRIVHASNMTKNFVIGTKGKDENFRPPDLSWLTYTEADLERTYREQ